MGAPVTLVDPQGKYVDIGGGGGPSEVEVSNAQDIAPGVGLLSAQAYSDSTGAGDGSVIGLLNRMTHAWFDLGNGRKVYRRVPEPRQKSSIACPYIVRPFSEPVQSMADGKYYTDAASLRATYKASGNPHGVDFIEVGNEDVTTFTPPQRDRKADREAIERAINDVENGNVPPILTELPV